jgi:hypothetical protein
VGILPNSGTFEKVLEVIPLFHRYHLGGSA